MGTVFSKETQIFWRNVDKSLVSLGYVWMRWWKRRVTRNRWKFLGFGRLALSLSERENRIVARLSLFPAFYPLSTPSDFLLSSTWLLWEHILNIWVSSPSRVPSPAQVSQLCSTFHIKIHESDRNKEKVSRWEESECWIYIWDDGPPTFILRRLEEIVTHKTIISEMVGLVCNVNGNLVEIWLLWILQYKIDWDT